MRATILAALAAIAACSSSPEPASPPPLGQGGFAGALAVGDPCDADQDGFDARTCGGLDCDDRNAAVNPAAAESCGNGIDDDCDGTTDEGCGCVPGDMEACWDGSEAQRNVGECRDGARRCLPSGNWGPCTGEVDEAPEGDACDGLDQDCDGTADGPGCGGCPRDAVEVCGNGLDDDCDGHIDNPEICTLSCSEVNPRGADPGALGCCLHDPPVPFSYTCDEYAGLPACVDRPCLDLDGDISTRCSKLCDAGGCVCGRRDGENILPSPDCGFQTPCSRMDCDDRRDQPCYSGPPATLGVGICHAGKHSCEGGAGQRAWTECVGEQVPMVEVCGNGIDDDCDGKIDEIDGATGRACPLRTDCVDGAVELCGNGLDDDCDGFADEGCPATAGSQSCWTGPPLARGVGLCKDGRQMSQADGSWGPCENQVLPAPEVCGDGQDSDCNGLGGMNQPEEVSCCVPSAETCDGRDEDCDGVADNGLLNRCGLCEGSCYDAVIKDMANCDAAGRTCEHVEPSALDPSLLTLSLQPPAEPSDVLYVLQAGTGGQFPPANLLQLDAGTGGVNWSRTLLFSTFFARVSASPDGSAWVVTGGQTPTLQHFDKKGDEACRIAVAASSNVLLVDAGGDVWLLQGQSNGRTLRRYSATEVLPDPTVARCAVVDLTPDDPNGTDIGITGGFDQIALDANRRMWLTATSQMSNPGVAILDLVSGQVKALTGFDGDSPALGPDGALYLGSPLRRVTPETVYGGTASDVEAIGSYGNLSNLNAAPDRTIFGTSSSGATRQLIQVDPVTGTTARSSNIPATGQATGLTLDGYGKLWTAASNNLVRFDPLSRTWDPLTITGGALVVMSTSSDRVARDLGRRQGSWSQVFDPGSYDVLWDQLDWSSYAPSGTRVLAVVHFSDAKDLLESSTNVCGPFENPPADISGCSGGRRYALVQLLFSGYSAPVAGDVRLTWSRP